MASGDSDAAIHTGVRGGKVYFLGATQTYIVDVYALLKQTLGHRCLYSFAGQTYVMPHNHLSRLDNLGKCTSYPIGNFFIELVWDSPTDIVRLETVNFLHTALA
jgi:hypothetical protein